MLGLRERIVARMKKRHILSLIRWLNGWDSAPMHILISPFHKEK